MKRVGLALVGNHPCKDLLRYTVMAESHGYDSVWLPEDLGLRDAIAPLASGAISTNKIRLATGILPIHYRQPAITAMTFATLDELSNGRMILALGYGVLPWLTQQGIPIRKPTTAMREYVQLLRGLWAGETVKHEGEVYKLDSVKLSFKPIRAEIPIYLAARGPKMFELAGETADGVLINEGFAAPKYFEWAKTSLAKGVEKAGRVLSDVDVAAYVFMSVADEHEAAKERVKPGVVSMLAQGVLTPQLERLGSSIDDVAPVIKACKQGDMRAACKLVPDRLLQNASIYGTPAECERQMRNLREVGLNIPIILPVGDWNTIIPLAKEW